jgi:general secretion pathway protein I
MDRILTYLKGRIAAESRPRGFTLLEVMVALAVLATTLTVIYQLHGHTMMISSSARFYNLAPMLAKSKLSELEQSVYKELADSSGDFGEDYPGYNWSIQIEDVESDLLTAKQYHLARFEVRVSQNEENSYTLRTYRFYVDVD